ncbi:hypothetical protein [Nonomuraea polychroma]|uniref:hypothetical protein n=1 Tax=Nonomuraea polychroma TaxID=46176 RepID=UPI0013E322C1|nr:hypothetical protein [Nonomuraea polychroma]
MQSSPGTPSGRRGRQIRPDLGPVRHQSVPLAGLGYVTSDQATPTPQTTAVLNDLPAGSYVLNVDLRIRQQPGDPEPFDAGCGLETPTGKIQHWDRAEVSAGQRWSMSFTRTVTLSSTTSVSLKCYASTKRYGTSGIEWPSTGST